METIEYKEVTESSLVNEINSIKHLNIEQLYFMFKNFLEAYIDCSKVFGRKADITLEQKKKFKEFRSILGQEKLYLNYLLDHLDSFNLDAVDRLLEQFDALNEGTILYYDNYFSRASYAAFREDKDMLYSMRHEPTLIEDDSYAKQIAGLSLNDDAIKAYLNYEKDFWDFIKSTTYSIEVCPEVARNMAFVTPIYDDEGFVAMIKLFAPKVVDLETALIALDVYTKAHNYYIDYLFRYNGHDKKFDKDKFISSLDYKKLFIKK